MSKTVLITGATDGIGLETAKTLVKAGHRVLLHGRNPQKLAATQTSLGELASGATFEGFVADLTQMSDVLALAKAITEKYQSLDVLINNAGVYRTANPLTAEGFDTRFVVNTFAPYVLTKRLLPIIGTSGRVINLSSAAQSPVDLAAMQGKVKLNDSAAYAQSKLALTMWSRHIADQIGSHGPVIVAVNPASMLGSKMVTEAYGVAGGDLQIGADILTRAALSEEFADASGKYFDNDQRAFASPHPDALDAVKNEHVVAAIASVVNTLLNHVENTQANVR